MFKSVNKTIDRCRSICVGAIGLIAISAAPSRADVTGSDWLISNCFYINNLESNKLSDTHVFVAARYRSREPVDRRSRESDVVILRRDACVSMQYKNVGKIYAIDKSKFKKIGSSTQQLNEYIDRSKKDEVPSFEVFYRGFFSEEELKPGRFPVFLSNIKQKIDIENIDGKSIVTKTETEYYYGDEIAWTTIGFLLSIVALLILYIFNLKRKLRKLGQQSD